MAIDEKGRVFFADTFGNANPQRDVYYIDPPYTGLAQPTGIGGSQPAGLLWEKGALLVCDLIANTVTLYDDQTFEQRTQFQATQPWNVARAANGDLLTIAFDGRLQRLVDEAAPETLFSGLQGPFDLAPMPDGSVWISEQGIDIGAPGRLTRRDISGTVLEDVTYDWDNPEGLALDSNGDLWVAETERNEVIRVNANGAQAIGKSLSLPIVIIPDSDGSLLFNLAGGQLMRVAPQTPDR